MSLSENTQGKKLLIINCKNTRFFLNITKESEMIKNPVPILWNLEGLYGWVPVEIVKNATSHWTDFAKENEAYSGNIEFTWQQAYRLRQDVGRILEELGK